MRVLFIVFLLFSGTQAIGAEATYEVPVTDDLKPYASFDLSAFIGKKANEEVVLYHLPPELTGGKAIPIRLTQKSKSPSGMTALYEGLMGEAGCMFLARETLCTISYPKMNLDPKAVEDYLSERFKGDPALPFLLDVAASFGSEPVGILRVSRN